MVRTKNQAALPPKNLVSEGNLKDGDFIPIKFKNVDTIIPSDFLGDEYIFTTRPDT